ncbi:MAG: response regulator transcription factor [Acidimicrobiia bacterium]|nr:response regulator transcription factor [Acidimicrobiia bacterium]
MRREQPEPAGAGGAPLADRAPIRVAVVEDHDLFAQALEFALRRMEMDVSLVPATSQEEILAAVARTRPSVVLLDLRLGEGFGSSLPLVGPIRDLGSDVVILTGVTDRAELAECLEAGAAGVVSKAEHFETLVEDVDRLVHGRSILPAHERASMLEELRCARAEARARIEPFERLTVREREVLQDLCDGLSAEAISEAAYVSITTIRSHIRSVLQKLGVGSQLAAVAMARRADWSHDQRRPR